MAKIYSLPDGIVKPEIDFGNYNRADYEAKEKKFLEDVKAWCLKRKQGDFIGEVISFPVADGSASYMVASMKPLELIFLPLMDEYEFQYVHLLTVKEVKEKITSTKKFNEMWAKLKK